MQIATFLFHQRWKEEVSHHLPLGVQVYVNAAFVFHEDLKSQSGVAVLVAGVLCMQL